MLILFQRWKVPNQSEGVPRKTSRTGIAKVVQTSFDASSLHANPQLAAESRMVDDGTGHKEVWRIEEFDIKEVPAKDHGKFYSGDCYIILYCYTLGSQDHFILYYWIGAKSSVDEQGTAAMWTVQMDDKLGGKAVQVRLAQGKETPHFMSMFDGQMVIYTGGATSSFDRSSGRTQQGFHREGDTYLLQVRGTSRMNTKAIEVECRAASLNSNDVFVLHSPSGIFIWNGKGSTGDEREMARHLASQEKLDPNVVLEGQEKPDFWTAIGGKEPYSNDPRLARADEDQDFCSRLFQCCNASGNFTVEEIMSFEQSDLVDDDVMLLDTGREIYIWIGSGSNSVERKEARNTAVEYLRTDPAKRDIDTPIHVIKQVRIYLGTNFGLF